MVSEIRGLFNESFKPEVYQAYVEAFNEHHPGALDFRIAETPLLIKSSFKRKIIDACESIVDVIVRPDFKELTINAIPVKDKVPNENDYADFIAFDFGICTDENGTLVPKLIEMQGFPTLFAYQALQADLCQSFFNIPDHYSSYLGGFDKSSYLNLLKEIILGEYYPENVILLEIYPEKQKTRIDFYCTKEYVGIETVCLTELQADGSTLFYEKNGQRFDIKRIYNRVIFDELDKYDLPADTIDIKKQWNVEWCPHPNWFYRISKFTLPFIDSPYVPKTFFLKDVQPNDIRLEDYVLKPLFSFAGMGVIIDLTKEDLIQIEDPQNWILQEKVSYADVIETPDIPAKVEIRIFYFWEKGKKRPVATHNLARLSKGKMIGVRYNADKEWVGGSICFFEKG